MLVANMLLVASGAGQLYIVVSKSDATEERVNVELRTDCSGWC